LQHANATKSNPDNTELDQINTSGLDALETASQLADRLQFAIERLTGFAPPPTENHGIHPIRSGAVGNIAEKIDGIRGHLNRIGDSIDRLQKVV
jgi:hypothetical protein